MAEEKNLVKIMMQNDKLETGDYNEYLILWVKEGLYCNEEEIKEWEFVTGRQETYDKIKQELESQEGSIIDILKSRILVDNPIVTEKISFSKAFSIYRFMRDMIDMKLVQDDSSFDITEYGDPEVIDS